MHFSKCTPNGPNILARASLVELKFVCTCEVKYTYSFFTEFTPGLRNNMATSGASLYSGSNPTYFLEWNCESKDYKSSVIGYLKKKQERKKNELWNK